MGRDPKYVCQKQQPKAEQNLSLSVRSPQPNDAGSSDEDEDDDDMQSAHNDSSIAKQLPSGDVAQ